MVAKQENDHRDFTIRAIMVEKDNEDAWHTLVEHTDKGIKTRWLGEHEQLHKHSDSRYFSDEAINAYPGYEHLQLFYRLDHGGAREESARCFDHPEARCFQIQPVPRSAFVRSNKL